MNYRYYETGTTDPCVNLATEEYLLLHQREGDIFMLWQNDNTVVIGRNQNTEAEINRSFVREHGVKVVRRTTGGGAVYHDLGNVNFSFITDYDEEQEGRLRQFMEPIADVLRSMGLNAEISGRNDILVEGKKVSGNAQRLERGRILHHGTLLFDSDPEMVAGALCVDEKKIVAKGIRSVRSRIGNIRDFLPEKKDLSDFLNALKEGLLGDANMESQRLSEKEIREIRSMADEKYRSWEWTYGQSPQFSTLRRQRLPGGTLEISFDLDKGKLTHISFFGDFLSLRDTYEVAEALIGCRFEREEVHKVLAGFSLFEFFGEICEDEILDILFAHEP